MTAFDVTTSLVTLSADDFVDFILSYFIELGMGLVEMVYFNPGLAAFLEWFNVFTATLKDRILARLPKWVIGRGIVPPKPATAMGTPVTGAAGVFTPDSPKNLESVAAEGGETVEPILDSFGGYSSTAMTLIYNIFVIELLIAYRAEIRMPIIYGIKNQDMLYYLLFALIMIPFQFIADVFTLSVLELYHGWKIYDYLIYTRYRFLQREARWKGLEDSLDECIDESVRTLDQMCFSSQYYMMMTVHVNGITMFVLGMQMILQANYNFFGDRIAPVVVLVAYAICVLVEATVLWLARRVDLWRVKHENTAWHAHAQEDDDFDIPGWEDLKGASHDAYMMNQRITSETFRFKFLNYNRAWLISQLPNILTPRTLRRARPYLINQFTRILNQLNQDISSDSDEDDDQKKAPNFGPVALTAPSRQIIRTWLAQARRRMRLREVVQPLIAKARGTHCEACLSRRQLQVECVHDLELLADKFDVEHPDVDFDQVAWKAFWMKNQSYRTICLNCIANRKLQDKADALGGGGGGGGPSSGRGDTAPPDDAPDWGPVFLKPTARAMLLGWHRKAQANLFGKGGKRRKKQAPVDLSDDEDDGDNPAFRNFGPVHVNPASQAILLRWLRTARASLQRSGDDAPDRASRRRRRTAAQGGRSSAGARHK